MRRGGPLRPLRGHLPQKSGRKEFGEKIPLTIFLLLAFSFLSQFPSSPALSLSSPTRFARGGGAREAGGGGRRAALTLRP